MKGKVKLLFTLFFTMLKIGLFTFGGGYAMIALLENEFVEKKNWLEQKDFLDITAVAGSAPGSVAINAATYMGYRLAGVPGSLTATVAVCIPSLVILYVISLFFDTFMGFTFVRYAFRGIQVCVVYLIMTAGIKMFRTMEKNPFSFILFGAVVLCMLAGTVFAFRISTVLYILICGFAGVAVCLISDAVRKDRNGKEKHE